MVEKLVQYGRKICPFSICGDSNSDQRHLNQPCYISIILFRFDILELTIYLVQAVK